MFEKVVLFLFLHDRLVLHFTRIVFVPLELYNLEDVFHQLRLDRFISGSVNAQSRRSIHFEEPRLLLFVNEDVEA